MAGFIERVVQVAQEEAERLLLTLPHKVYILV